MKKNITKKLLLVFIMAMPLACNDIIDLKPAQSLPTDVALADFAGVSTALVGVYDGFQNLNYYGRDFVVFPEIRADNVYLSVKNSNRFVPDYNYQLSANTTQTVFWNAAYAAVVRANNVINSIDKIKDGGQAAKDQILAEALTLRALGHFDLVRVFSKPYYDGAGAQLGVPIKLDNKVVDIARSSVGDVYNQIIADLTAAKAKADPGATNPYRISLGAINALLARVYLYKGDNANAVASATEVISSGNYELTPAAELLPPAKPEDENFWNTSGNAEEIFTLQTVQNESRGSDNLGQIYNPGTGYGDIRVSSDIRAEFAASGAGDARIAASYYLGAAGEYYVNKYIGEEATNGLVSPKILRLAEVYLIRAEANAKIGTPASIALADADIAVIRTRSNAPALAPSATAAIALAAALREKRLEFAFEGHRSFDLFRNGINMTRTQCNTGKEVNVAGFCTVPANSPLRAYPIPQRELDANKLMVPND